MNKTINGTETEEELSSNTLNVDEGEAEGIGGGGGAGARGGENESEERIVEGFAMNLEGRGPEVIAVTYMSLPDDLDASTLCFWVNPYHFHPYSTVLSESEVQIYSE